MNARDSGAKQILSGRCMLRSNWKCACSSSRDDKDLNRQIAAALSQAGYAVDRAFDGEEGWFLGDTEPYDAVVLDLGLPKKDGISILGEWRRAGRLPKPLR